MSEHMKNGNTFSKMDASIFNSIAQTKEFQGKPYISEITFW